MLILFVLVGASPHKQDDDFTSSAGLKDCPKEGSVSIRVFRVDGGTGSEEQLNNVNAVVLGGKVQGRPASIILCREVGLALDQELHHRVISFNRCVV